MYFVISVFPISITSGELPPASVASNFCRWLPQVWYCMLTDVPGWSFSNWELTWATSATQSGLLVTSVCSQTVTVLAAALLFAPETPPTAIARASAATTEPTTRMCRLFMSEPSRALAGLSPLHAARCAGAPSGGLVYTTSPPGPEGSHTTRRLSRPILDRRPAAARDGRFRCRGRRRAAASCREESVARLAR